MLKHMVDEAKPLCLGRRLYEPDGFTIFSLEIVSGFPATKSWSWRAGVQNL
jgi:hypothetical protein